jgi:hypothetical protein
MKQAKNFKKVGKKKKKKKKKKTKQKKCKKRRQRRAKTYVLQKQAPCQCNAGRRCRRG